MRDELLVLLEDGPHETAELAKWLTADFGAVVHELRCLKDAGLVRRINLAGERCWVLTGYVVTKAPRAPRQPRTHRNSRGVPATEPPASVPSPSGRRTRIIDGEEFEVSWDGT